MSVETFKPRERRETRETRENKSKLRNQLFIEKCVYL